MKPISIFVSTFYVGSKSYEGDNWDPEGVTYTIECINDLVEREGMTARQLNFPHPHNQSWFLISHKDAEISVPDLNAIFYPLKLKYELESLRTRLQTLENHPYVRLGKKVKVCLRWLKRVISME